MIILGQIDNRTSEEETFLFSVKKKWKTLRLCKGIERTAMLRKSDKVKELRYAPIYIAKRNSLFF
jgi:hypothetical protein